jgi:molecular chaperone GrpE
MKDKTQVNNAPKQGDAVKPQETPKGNPEAVPVQCPDGKITELTDTLKHLQADFENHIKQFDKRSAQLCEQASARVLVKVLSIVDEFERSLKQLEDAKIDPKLIEGMRMVNKNVHGVLDAEGVRPIECIGKKLDPFRHEVLRKVKKDGVADDTIVEEHVRGYLLKDKVLRHSKVTVVSNGVN